MRTSPAHLGRLRTRRQAQRPLNRHSRRLLVEALEDRRLLAGELFPNDPDFPQQWMLHNTGQMGGIVDADIDAPEAWTVTTGSMATVVAVLDSGVDYTDPDLYLNIWLNEGEIPANLTASLTDADGDGLITFHDLNDPSNASFVVDVNATGYIDGGDLLADPAWENGVDEDANGRTDDVVGWDFLDNDNDARSTTNAHGTAMSKLIGSIGNNGIAKAGVNWDVRIMPIRIHEICCDQTVASNTIAGLDYAVGQGATISSNSWGDNSYSQGMYDAISRAHVTGHLFVAAAGNLSQDTDVTPFYPASYDLDNIVSVAGILSDNQLSSASNYGVSTVDLGSYSEFGGTSNPAAITSGVAALLKSVHPDWTYTQIKNRILSTVDSIPALAGKSVTGGRLNAANALGVAQFSISDASATEGGTAMTFIDAFITPGSGGFKEARGIDYGPDGNLYVNRESFHTDPIQQGYVQRYDGTTGAFIDIFATHPDMTGAKDVEFGPDGNLYVPNNVGDNVYRFNGTTGEFIDVFIPTGSGGLETPRTLIFGLDGNGDGNQDLYVTSAQTDNVLRYDGVTGAFIDAFVTTGSGGLNDPTALVFGPDGDLYVASGAHSDFFNGILRYDGVTGAFKSTFVPAGSAGLTLAPTAGVIFGPDVNGDAALDLYVSNGEVDEVLIYNGLTGAYLQTFIPPGLGGLDNPKGLLFDHDGNLLVVNNGDHSVRRYGASSQASFTVSLSAPSETPVTVGYSTANDSATAGSDFTAASGTITFAPGQTSQTILVQTLDDSLVESNETFVVNLSNGSGGVIANGRGVGTIQDDDASRTISISNASINEFGSASSFIAPGSGGLDTPRGLAQGPDGSIYVASQNTDSILRFDATTGAFLDTFVTSGSGGLNTPDGVAFGPDGHLYVASGDTDAILKFDATTGTFLSAFVPSGSGGLDNPRGIVFGPDGNLYVSSFENSSILRYSGASGGFMDAFVASGSGGLSRPMDLVFGPDGHLYVGIWDQGSPSAVSRYDGVTGSFVDIFVAHGEGGAINPRGLAFDQDGRLYLADSSTHSIHRYDSQGVFLDNPVVSGASLPLGPMDIIFDAHGTLLISSTSNNNSVVRYDRGVLVTLSEASPTPITVDYQTLDGSATAPNGYTAQSGTVTFAPGETSRRVVLATRDDALVNGDRTFTIQASNATGATIDASDAVVTIVDDDAARQFTISDATAVEGDFKAHYRGNFIDVIPGINLGNSVMFHGDYFYTSPGPSSVSPIDRYDATTGAFVDHFIPASLELDAVRTPVIRNGFLYVGSGAVNGVLRFDATTGAPAGVSGLPGDAVFVSPGSGDINGPQGLSFGPDGNLYVTGRTSFTVHRYDGTTGQPLGTLDTSGAGALQWPENLTIDAAGVAYVASAGTHQVQKYSTVTGAYLGAISNPALSSPFDVTFGPDSLLYVLSRGNTRILRFTAEGAFVDDYVAPGSGGMVNISRMAFGPDGDLYVGGHSGANAIYRFGTDNEAVFTVTASTPSSVPVSVDFVSSNGTAIVGADYATTSGMLTFGPGVTTKTILVPLLDDSDFESNETFTVTLSNPLGGVIADGQGVGTIVDDDPAPTKFFVVNDGSFDQTYEYGPTGAAVEDYAIDSGNAAPRGAASTAAGDKVWIVDANRNVFIYDTSGSLLGTWSVGGFKPSAQLEGIATNGADMWIVDNKSDKVYRYAGAAGRLSGSQNPASNFSLNSGNRNPTDIVTDGTHLWVLNNNSTDKVFKYTLSGSLVGSWTISGGGGAPTGITLDPAAPGHLWIVDNAADRVYQYDSAISRTSGSQAASSSFDLAPGNTNPQGIADPPVAAGERATHASAPAALAGGIADAALVELFADGPEWRFNRADGVLTRLTSTSPKRGVVGNPARAASSFVPREPLASGPLAARPQAGAEEESGSEPGDAESESALDAVFADCFSE